MKLVKKAYRNSWASSIKELTEVVCFLNCESERTAACKKYYTDVRKEESFDINSLCTVFSWNQYLMYILVHVRRDTPASG